MVSSHCTVKYNWIQLNDSFIAHWNVHVVRCFAAHFFCRGKMKTNVFFSNDFQMRRFAKANPMRFKAVATGYQGQMNNIISVKQLNELRSQNNCKKKFSSSTEPFQGSVYHRLNRAKRLLSLKIKGKDDHHIAGRLIVQGHYRSTVSLINGM